MMPFMLVLVTIFVALTGTANILAAAPVAEPEIKRDLEVRAPAACGNPKFAVPLYRAFQPDAIDHFYTTSFSEWRRATKHDGFQPEGITGYVFRVQQPGTVPLYRLYNSQDTNHFYTTDAPEKDYAVANLGYRSEGVAGWVYPNPDCGGHPLYRAWNGESVDHFYTMSIDEWNAAVGIGWAQEGIAAYIFPF